MSYSDFTLQELKARFGLVVEEECDLFPASIEAPLPPVIANWLSTYSDLGGMMRTEKGRSEMLVAPILAGLRTAHRDRLSLHSGIPLNVSEADGLKGICDYIIAGCKSQIELDAPICVLVEAKREDINGGVAQCLAEMLGAARFNADRKHPIASVFGVVTSGLEWRFMKLTGLQANIHAKDFLINQPEKIYGILEYITLDQQPNLN